MLENHPVVRVFQHHERLPSWNVICCYIHYTDISTTYPQSSRTTRASIFRLELSGALQADHRAAFRHLHSNPARAYSVEGAGVGLVHRIRRFCHLICDRIFFISHLVIYSTLAFSFNNKGNIMPFFFSLSQT